MKNANSRIFSTNRSPECRWSSPALTMSRDEFIAFLTRDIPPRPADMERIVAANIAA